MRRALRLLRIGLHLLAGYAICALLYPLLPARARVAVRRSWARGVLAILGVRLRVDDLRIAPGSLVVSNHVSWLDAVVLNALLDAAIVAKSETRRWSLLGMMLERNDTLFIERRVSRALLAVNAAIGARLGSGVPVIIFPEGTTTDGANVLTFRPALFQPAVAAGHPVHALALLYRNGDGQRSHEAAFIDDMSLWHSLCAVTSVPALGVEVHSCVVLASTQGLRRREAARLTHRAVQDRVYGPRSLDAREEAAGPIGQAATASVS